MMLYGTLGAGNRGEMCREHWKTSTSSYKKIFCELNTFTHHPSIMHQLKVGLVFPLLVGTGLLEVG